MSVSTGEPNVVGHFLALVPCQGTSQVGGKSHELTCERAAHFVGRTPFG